MSANKIPPCQSFQALMERTEELEQNYAQIMVLLQELKAWIARNQAEKAEVQAEIEALMEQLQAAISQLMELLDAVFATARAVQQDRVKYFGYKTDSKSD